VGLDLPDNSADAIFMAYGIRNMPDYQACLANLQRILKPGGVLAIHEFSLPEGFLYRLYWRLLGYGIILPFSSLVTGNITIFSYLIKSVLTFLSPKALSELLEKTGFDEISIHSSVVGAALLCSHLSPGNHRAKKIVPDPDLTRRYKAAQL